MELEHNHDFITEQTKYQFTIGKNDIDKIHCDNYDVVCRAGTQYNKISDKMQALADLAKAVEEANG